MPWSDDNIERLKTLWARGMTAGQIADSIPGKTRNAILGMARRLDLEARKPCVDPAPTRFARIVKLVAEGGKTLGAAASLVGMPAAVARERWAALVSYYDMGEPVTALDDVTRPIR